MKAKDKEVKPPTNTPSKTVSNYGRRNNLPEHVQVISISFHNGDDKKGGRSGFSRWFQRFRSVLKEGAHLRDTRKQRGRSQVQVPTSPPRTWLNDLTFFFYSAPRGSMSPGNTIA